MVQYTHIILPICGMIVVSTIVWLIWLRRHHT
jgi:hypothetical protein